MANIKLNRRQKIKKGIRLVLTGTTERPRLSVFRSNKAIYAQIIDDVQGITLTSASSVKATDKVNKTDMSRLIGKQIAEKAIAAGITQVVFDRNGYLYHGRVKSLAEGAREGGLIF